MNRKRTLVAFFILALLLAACGRVAPQMTSEEAPMAAASPAADLFMEMEAVEESAQSLAFRTDASAGQTVALAQDAAQERVIIRTANMSIVVADTEAAIASIAQMVDDNGGWVVSSNLFQYDEEAMTGSMVVRVPAEGFESFLEAVRRLSTEVTRISTSGEDVTEEYVDLSARLQNLEATAERVRAFLDEARTVEEALEVNRELSRLEGEIEALKGRLLYLQQSAAFSMISIDLTPDALAQPLVVGGWQPQGVARNALETLVATLQTLVDAAIWLLIYVLPIALLIALPTWLLIRFVRRRRAERRAAGSENDAEVNSREPA